METGSNRSTNYLLLTFTGRNQSVPVPCKMTRFVNAGEDLGSQQVISIFASHSTCAAEAIVAVSH